MEMSALNWKVNSLPLQQQRTLEAYVDFLLFSTSSKIEQKKRPPLDFSKYRVITYTAFVADGFWDIYSNKEGDGIGPKKELPGGKPYSYIPYSWTEVYKK